MADDKSGPGVPPKDVVLKAEGARFTIDSGYVIGEAREAIKTFMAPLSGVYRAATGASKTPVAAEEGNRSKR